jgi:hypothetical protein
MATLVRQYFHRSDYASKQSHWDLSQVSFELMTTDSYSDEAIQESILKTKLSKELFGAALQTAIVGQGNKTFGTMKINNQVVDLKDLFAQCKVKMFETLGSKLDPGDLTPRRLQRFFRYHIRDFLIENPSTSSYLFKKYSTMDTKYRSVCFPGAEHMCEDQESALYILQTYMRLDMKIGLNITDRIARVLSARNLLTLTELRNINQMVQIKPEILEDFNTFRLALQNN